ncbi:hypothetical protein [Winogradskyella sp. 3972H.M.0a.05]|uniref:hypothetical protein n=1 Tax=Winogradskyella sp. 3972H.M.0a.05 TaxID=2950277 RepID=UPI00339A431D
MKDFKFIIIPVIILVYFLISSQNSISKIDTGDIVFTSFNFKGADQFSIITLSDIQPNTTIYFSDSEWNGNRFGIDEGCMTWNSGHRVIKSGTKIFFKNISTFPVATIGKVTSTLKLSTDNDALFAYTGNPRLPTTFLAAISNSKKSYGTLINTGLIEGQSAITFPKGTYKAYIKDENFSFLAKNRTEAKLNSSIFIFFKDSINALAQGN